MFKLKNICSTFDLYDLHMPFCRLGIPEHSLIPLSQADCDKGRELLTRPYMSHFPLWKQEVGILTLLNFLLFFSIIDWLWLFVKLLYHNRSCCYKCTLGTFCVVLLLH